MSALERTVKDFTDQLSQKHAAEIARNPREFKQQVLKLIRRTLPPKRGRPASPQIEAALAMLREGKSVRNILRAQIAGFDHLDPYTRYLAEKAIRQGRVAQMRVPHTCAARVGFYELSLRVQFRLRIGLRQSGRFLP
jgi:hypothetical protein